MTEMLIKDRLKKPVAKLIFIELQALELKINFVADIAGGIC